MLKQFNHPETTNIPLTEIASTHSLARKRSRILPPPLCGFDYSQLSIIPRLSRFKPEEVDLETQITKSFSSPFPFLASPMDTTIGRELAVKIFEQKGLPLLHGFYNNIQGLYALVEELKTLFPGDKFRLGLLISPDLSQLDPIFPLFADTISVVALDTLHWSPHLHLEAVQALKDRFPHLEIISGNVVFGEDCRALIEAGVDAIRVGMTSASINRGRELTGCGRRQASAVWDCAKMTSELGIPLIADGGISSISDVAIAFALGADTVMMGQMFASLPESAAPTKVNASGQTVKVYRGMSRKETIDNELIPEGIAKELLLASGFDETIADWLRVLKLAIARAGFNSLKTFKMSALLEFSI